MVRFDATTVGLQLVLDVSVAASLARLTGARLTTRRYSLARRKTGATPIVKAFTSKWNTDDLINLNLPTRDTIVECEMQECGHWVVPPESKINIRGKVARKLVRQECPFRIPLEIR